MSAAQHDLTGSSGLTSPSLLSRLRHRDGLAWERFVDLYGPLIFHWCRRHSLSEADSADLMQEVFAAVARKIDGFDYLQHSGRFRGWLWVMTRNKIRDHRRRSARQFSGGALHALENTLENLPDEWSDDSSADSLREVRSLVRRALTLIEREFQPQTWQAFWRAVVDERPRDMLQFAESLAPFCAVHRLDRLVREARDRMKADEFLTSDAGAHSQPDRKSRRPNRADAAAAASPRTRPRAARRSSWVLSGLLLAVFAAVVATVITLQTGDGQLVIETTVPDVTVEIKRSGKRVESLTVSHEVNRLQLRAGEYEVQVVGKSDGLHIENQKFTLRRGEQVVARIVHEAAPALPERPSSVSPGIPDAPEPTFDGKTASEWVAVLYEDRSPARVTSALQALQKLGVDADQPQRAVAGKRHGASRG